MEIIIEDWKMSKSGKSANLFSGADKYYLPLKKIALKVGDISPEFKGSIFTVDGKDLIKDEKTFWIRINKFKSIKLEDGHVYDWKELLKVKKEVFGNRTNKKENFEYIDPKEW